MHKLIIAVKLFVINYSNKTVLVSSAEPTCWPFVRVDFCTPLNGAPRLSSIFCRESYCCQCQSEQCQCHGTHDSSPKLSSIWRSTIMAHIKKHW